jgi:hypothetical protein
MMRRLLLAAASIVLMPVAANAAKTTWIAACYDGKNLQYNQTLDGKGFLYMEIAEGDYLRMALVQKSYDGNKICSVTINALPGGNHFLKVCADKTNEVITVKYKDTTGKEPSIKDTAPYCKAAVTVH